MAKSNSLPAAGSDITLKGKQYHIESELYDGPFSKVYVINKGYTQYAMKIERTVGPVRPVLKLDALVLRQLNERPSAVGFPRLLATGRTPLYKYIIMELVGPDLQRLRRSMPMKKRKNGTIVERRSAASLMGTIYYASINAHNFSEQCRKDDLESWFYMIIEMIVGTLPWFIHDPKKQHLLIGEWKRFTRGPGRRFLLADSPQEFDKILDIIDETFFNAKPNYRIIHAFIDQAMDRLELDKNKPFEWEQNPKILRKATVIGERGESVLASKLLQKKETKDGPIDCLN